MKKYNISNDNGCCELKDIVNLCDIFQNVRSYNDILHNNDCVHELLDELLSWYPSNTLDYYLSIYTQNSRYINVECMDLMQKQKNFSLDESSEIVQCVEDTMAKFAYESEQTVLAHLGNISSLCKEADLTRWGESHSIDTFLDALREELRSGCYIPNKINIYEVVAIVMQAMELGFVDMDITFDRHYMSDMELYLSQPYEVYTRMRFGEYALFIFPFRYRNLMSILCKIREKRRSDTNGAYFDLERLSNKISSGRKDNHIEIAYGITIPSYNMTNRLCRVYELFIRGGQKFNEFGGVICDRRMSPNEITVACDKDNQLRLLFNKMYNGY